MTRDGRPELRRDSAAVESWQAGADAVGGWASAALLSSATVVSWPPPPKTSKACITCALGACPLVARCTGGSSLIPKGLPSFTRSHHLASTIPCLDLPPTAHPTLFVLVPVASSTASQPRPRLPPRLPLIPYSDLAPSFRFRS